MTTEPLFKIQLSESQFQSQVTQLANLFGWSWMHIRTGMNLRGYYRTPISGPLGAGWPDLVLTKDQRLLFVELKAEKGKVTGLQSEVMGVLGLIPCAEVYVWRPSDWDSILEILGGQR